MGLGKKVEVRFSSVADMSLRYTVILAITFFVCLALCGLSVLPSRLFDNEELSVVLLLLSATLVPIVALIFAILKWFQFVRIGRAFHSDELGFSKFKHLKRFFTVAFVLTLLLVVVSAGEISKDTVLTIAAIILLFFDSFVLLALLVFVPMAWHIGCAIPTRIYLEIAAMLTMFCLQVLAVLW
jgi:hypothetical protein